MSLLSVAAWLFAGLLTLVALAGLAVAYFVVKSMRSPPFRVNAPGGSLPSDGPAVHFLWKPHITDPLTNFGIPFTNIDIPSAKEGLMLRGWLVDGRDIGGIGSGSVIVCVHGGGRDRRTYLRLLPFLTSTLPGVSCILYDLRDHGTSDCDGIGLSMGIREHADVLAVASHAVNTLGYKRVLLFGTSLGASSVVLAAGRLMSGHYSSLPSQALCGVIAENGVDDVGLVAAGLVAVAARVYHIDSAWWFPLLAPSLTLARVVAPWFAVAALRKRCANTPEQRDLMDIQTLFPLKYAKDVGLGMYTCDAVSLLGGCPLLLSHGTADFVVDVRSSEHLHAIASKHCTAVEPLYIVQDAIHCGLFDKGGEDFKQIVGNFIRRCFTGLADVEGIAAVAHDAGDVAVPPVLAEPPLRYRSQRRKDN